MHRVRYARALFLACFCCSSTPHPRGFYALDVFLPLGYSPQRGYDALLTPTAGFVYAKLSIWRTNGCFLEIFERNHFVFRRQVSTGRTFWPATSRTAKSTSRSARSAPVSPTKSSVPSGRSSSSTRWRTVRGAGVVLLFVASKAHSLLRFTT